MTRRVGAGKLRPVSSVGRAFWSRMRLVLAALVVVLSGLASQASAQDHGFVDPCTLFFVEDAQTMCEECPFDHSNLNSCAESVGTRGYTFQCRTRGHSTPREIWCKPRGREIPRELVLAGVVGGVVLLAAGFLWWKRRGTA